MLCMSILIVSISNLSNVYSIYSQSDTKLQSNIVLYAVPRHTKRALSPAEATIPPPANNSLSCVPSTMYRSVYQSFVQSNSYFGNQPARNTKRHGCSALVHTLHAASVRPIRVCTMVILVESVLRQCRTEIINVVACYI